MKTFFLLLVIVGLAVGEDGQMTQSVSDELQGIIDGYTLSLTSSKVNGRLPNVLETNCSLKTQVSADSKLRIDKLVMIFEEGGPEFSITRNGTSDETSITSLKCSDCLARGSLESVRENHLSVIQVNAKTSQRVRCNATIVEGSMPPREISRTQYTMVNTGSPINDEEVLSQIGAIRSMAKLKLKDLKKRAEEQRKKILEEKKQRLDELTKSQDLQIAVLQETINARIRNPVIKGWMDGATHPDPVRFVAKLMLKSPNDLFRSKNKVLRYRNVTVNEGDGYHRWLGEFWAPVGGYFLFHYSAFAVESQIIIDLLLNGKTWKTIVVGARDEWRRFVHGSTIMKLSPGDSVAQMVRRSRGNNFTDPVFVNKFEGFLLHPSTA